MLLINTGAAEILREMKRGHPTAAEGWETRTRSLGWVSHEQRDLAPSPRLKGLESGSGVGPSGMNFIRYYQLMARGGSPRGNMMNCARL